MSDPETRDPQSEIRNQDAELEAIFNNALRAGRQTVSSAAR